MGLLSLIWAAVFMQLLETGNFEILVTFGSLDQGVQPRFRGERHRRAHTDTEIALQNGAKL